ncbi:MAG: Ni/Fe hydrogenase subunit alpha [candidate division Zixibacteria bacterium]|jgi:coenzyme F420-reducing hydrogenase alpha subunit|nr:Ni/Fe hydrogenase subunit alpha [candidate division Zixibacteria bacterium]
MISKTIKVDYLARVEGEGKLLVRIKNGKVVEAKLGIFEPPRFFEAFMRGRYFTEAPDITARICGICPVAYQMSSSYAMEDACGATVDGQLRALRRLIYCGEYIESHALHVYMLHAPDFLGYEDAIQMAKDHAETVKQGLQLKKIGNDLMIALGGREIHPINTRVGGFYKAPTKKQLQKFVDPLKWALETSLATVGWTAQLPFPDFERDYEFVSMRHPDEYPFTEGHVVSSKGIDIPISRFLDTFEEIHVEHSTSLQAKVIERGDYLAGPMARYANNFDKLPEVARQAAREAGLGEVCRNPFKSIIVRSVELVFACHEALRLIEQYEPPDRPFVEVVPRTGVGHGCSEAPRGLLYHRYRIGADGLIQEARIIPPTSQNQQAIEEDLRRFVEKNLHLSTEKLTWQCEQAVRNYDPCISCSCHFLKLQIEKD